VNLANTPIWKIVIRLVLLDIFYFVALLAAFYALRETFAAEWVLRSVAILYFLVPATLSLVFLWAGRALSSIGLRQIGLIAWAIVLPGFIFFLLTAIGMEACHLDWLPHCAPY